LRHFRGAKGDPQTQNPERTNVSGAGAAEGWPFAVDVHATNRGATEQDKLLHVVRVDATGPHWKVPDLKTAGKENGDQADRMMLWTSTDNGAHWRRHGKYGTFGAGGEMYPRFLRLKDGRLLLTFTVRSSSTDGHALGLRAIISDDDGDTWNFNRDRLVIHDQNVGASGGGFGNTVQTNNGTLISCYSYRGHDNKTHVEAVRWRLPKKGDP